MFKAIGHFILTGGYALARVRYPQVFVQADLDAKYDVFGQDVVSRESLDIAAVGAAAREVLNWNGQC